jgi:hypothetical protein
MSKVIAPVAVEIPAAVGFALTQAVEAESKNYGAKRRFAATINDTAPADCVWYALEGNGQKLPPVIAAIKAKYYEQLKAINYPNVSNAWGMIKKYAREDAANRAMFGEVPPEKADDGGASTDAATGDTKQARSPQLRLVEELTALHEYCAKMTAKNDAGFTAKHKAAHGHIVQALKAIGVLEVTA